MPDALDRAAELAQSIGDADRVEGAKAVAFYVADRFVASRGTENEVPVRYLLDVIEVLQFFGERLTTAARARCNRATRMPSAWAS